MSASTSSCNDVAPEESHNHCFSPNIALRPYQAVSVQRLCNFFPQGIPCLEIRDQGLGTKIQTAFHFANLATNKGEWGCHLVVVKDKFELYGWRAAFANCATSLKVKVIAAADDDDDDDDDDLRGHQKFYPILNDSFITCNTIITYMDHLRLHSSVYKTFDWKTLVLDKVISLTSSSLDGDITSPVLNLNYHHLVIYLNSLSTTPEILALMSSDDEDKMDVTVSNFSSEPLKDLVSLCLKDKIIPYGAPESQFDWVEGVMPTPSNDDSVCPILSMDEAVKVFRSLTRHVRKGDVVDQLQTMSFMTLASPLPSEPASTYSEKLGTLIEESPDVRSQGFLDQVNDLYNTCAHLDGFGQVADDLFICSLNLDEPVTLEFHHFHIDDSCEDVVTMMNSSIYTRYLLTLYAWGLGLIDNHTPINPNAPFDDPTLQSLPPLLSSTDITLALGVSSSPESLYSLEVIRLLLGLASDCPEIPYDEKLYKYKKMIEEINKEKLFDTLPKDLTKSLLNLTFLLKPSRSSTCLSKKLNLCWHGNKVTNSDVNKGVKIEVIKEEAMDCDDDDDAVARYGDRNDDDDDDDDGTFRRESDHLKELMHIGRKCFEDELSKFLISCRKVLAQCIKVKTSKKPGHDWLAVDKFVASLLTLITDPIGGVVRRRNDYVDKKIIGFNKGKLSSLSVLLSNDRLLLKEGRFVVLTCHKQTSDEMEWFLNRKNIVYIKTDPDSDPNDVRKSIAAFNYNHKYTCLLVSQLTHFSWQSVIHVLGIDALPLAKNLVVLDEEVGDWKAGPPSGHQVLTRSEQDSGMVLSGPDTSAKDRDLQGIDRESKSFLWHVFAMKMSTAQDINVFRLYYKNTIEGYQVNRRWMDSKIEAWFENGGFPCVLGRIHHHQCYPDSDQLHPTKFGAIESCDKGNDDEDGDDLEYIYSSHQETLKLFNEVTTTGHSCSCLKVNLHKKSNSNGGKEVKLQPGKLTEINCYALLIVERQLRNSDISLKREKKPPPLRKELSVAEDMAMDINSSQSDDSMSDLLLTYLVDYANPESFISDLTGEKMPIWAPPTPPQDEDLFVDNSLLFLYESTPMSETQLPSIYVRKGTKRLKLDDSSKNTKSFNRDSKHESPLTCQHRPRSLFERPPTSSPSNTFILSTSNSLAMGFHIDRDGRLINKAGIPVGQPYTKSPTVQLPMPRPNPETQADQIDWLIHEEWALLQAYQIISQDGSGQADLASSVQPPPQSRLPNWELIACIVNGFSRVFRSPRQCRLRYENVILPREEGRSHFDNNLRKLKKSSKGLYKTKTNRLMKTIQMYSQDSNRSISTHFSHRFDLFRNFFGKKSSNLKSLNAAAGKNNMSYVALMVEHNINYEEPMSPMAIADLKLMRVSKEKEKRAAPEKVQNPSTCTLTASVADPGVPVQQQQQQTTEATPAVAGSSISPALTVLGAGLSVVLPNSQIRMAVPGVPGTQQQQQQVILQAAVAQQQMSIVASAASNALLGKVPLISGVNNSIPAVRNLANLSFVVNQSAANQQGTTFVTVSKSQAAVVSSVGIVTSLSPAAFKAIRNINPSASQLASSINITQNKATPTAATVAFPSILQQNRLAIRGAGAIQLNQRLTQKPGMPQQQHQQQVTLATTGLAGLQKLNPVGLVSLPAAQMGQTFHVKNTQVVLKQRQQVPAGQQQQQLAGATVVSRLAATPANQGTALQFQQLQLQSKPLLEVIQQQQSSQQQQILATNLTCGQASSLNMTALIKTVSNNSSLANVVSVGNNFTSKNIFSGKVVTPTPAAIRQSQMTKRPTITAINLQGQGNRTALVGIQQVAKGTGASSVIYQQPKLVLQPQGGVKQSPSVQLQQGSAILAMTPRGPTVNISAIGLAPTVAAGNVTIPINTTCIAQGVAGSSQQVRVAKQMINSSKIAPIVQHIIRAPQQQVTQLPAASAAVASAAAATSSISQSIRPQQQNPHSG